MPELQLPPPPPPPPREQFALLKTDGSHLFCDIAELRKLVESKTVKSTSRVYSYARERWIYAEEVPGIASVLAAPSLPSTAPVSRTASPPTDDASFATTFLVAAWLLYTVAAALAAFGLSMAYQESEYPNSIVGGDAYNFIIFAGRGAVWAGAAVVAAVIGAGFHIAGTVARSRTGKAV